MGERLKGKRVLVTQASAYMGPVTAQVLAEVGALKHWRTTAVSRARRLGKWLAGSLALLLGMAAGFWSFRNSEGTTPETNASDTVLPPAAASAQGERTLRVASHALSGESRPQPRLRSEQLGTAVGVADRGAPDHFAAGCRANRATDG